jgi:hypothetical protein
MPIVIMSYNRPTCYRSFLNALITVKFYKSKDYMIPINWTRVAMLWYHPINVQLQVGRMLLLASLFDNYENE